MWAVWAVSVSSLVEAAISGLLIKYQNINPSMFNRGVELPPRSLSSTYMWNREIYIRVFLWLFLNMVLLQNAAFNKNISLSENPRWWSEKDKNLNVTDHFIGTLYTYYTLHRNINPTIPADCTFPWIAGVSALWAPKWIRTEEAHSVWVRFRLHGGHHTSFVRPEDKQHRCSAVDDAQQGRHQHRKWKEEAADDSWLQRHQRRSG